MYDVVRLDGRIEHQTTNGHHRIAQTMVRRSRQLIFLIVIFLGVCAAIVGALAVNSLIRVPYSGGDATGSPDKKKEVERGTALSDAPTVDPAAASPDNLVETARLLDAEPAQAAQTGFSVAISGDTAIVGSPGESGNRGSASIFVRNGATWELQQEIIGSDSIADDHFGWSVSIAGETAVVGAYDLNEVDQGAAYVFVRNGLTWSQQHKLTPAGGLVADQFGSSVSISGDTIVVGAFGKDNSRGSVYVFFRNGASWEQQQVLSALDGASGDEFGWSVGMSGDRMVVGAPGDDSFRGAAYLFDRSGGTWSQTAKVTASDGAAFDRFGYSSGIDGSFIVVGSPLDNDNGILSGSAYVFSESGGVWQQQAKLLANDRAVNDKVGGSVAIYGDTLVIGSSGDDLGSNIDQGSAYLFTRTENGWTQSQKFSGSDGLAGDNFGGSVSLGPGVVVSGSYLDDSPFMDAGSAYIFTSSSQAAPVIVAGRVLTPDGRGLRSAQVRITDVLLGTSITTTTSTLGYFQFEVQNGRDYLINVNSRRYRFSSLPITVTGDIMNIELVGLE